MAKRLDSVLTPWTDIVNAQRNPTLRARCLELLAEKYYEPVRGFILQTLRVGRPERADDLVQEFFTRFLAKNSFDILDREHGRLRNWFMASVRNFVRDERKKGGRRNPESVFTEFGKMPPGEPSLPDKNGFDPGEEFNRQWAMALFNDAIQAFRMYCRDKGKMHYYRVFERHVLSGGKDAVPGYIETARELKLSVKDVNNYLGRSRKKFQEILRAVVRNTVANEEDVEKELRDLRVYFK